MSISSATVKFHIDRARGKLRGATRAHAVTRCIMGGVLWGPRPGRR
jgi:DNA-binding CsgD family transcriptional regulator